jgi:molybdate-binding protein/DNA-binding transcriptional regulator YhcF (GntR family)
VSGEHLPTVRDLARDLGLNPSTVAKAYHELERFGIIRTHRGGGSFVAAIDKHSLIDSRDDRLNAILATAALEALTLGYEPDEVEGRFVAHVARWRERRSGALAAEATVARPAEIRFAGSHDLAVELLIGRLKRSTATPVSARYVGSLGGLIALAQGEAEVAGAHLLDEETGDYNFPFVRRLLSGQAVRVITLVERWQGLIVRRGNPKIIERITDLTRPDLVFVNRQRGSGTRVLLDHHLRALGIPATGIRGYQREEQTHVSVAAAVADGSADAGLGIESAARAAGLDFVPLFKERYDLVLLQSAVEQSWFPSLTAILASPEFRNVVAAMGGYDLAHCGEEPHYGAATMGHDVTVP